MKYYDDVREIKFRGYSHALEKWFYGSIVYKEPYTNDGSVCGVRDIIEEDGSRHPVSKVGQFTGLYDIHGTEIYEGDIIDFIKDGARCDTPCYVKWHPFLTIFYLCFSHETEPKGTDTKASLGGMIYNHGYKVEVIGNIYDNGELIPQLNPYITCG